VIDVLAAAGWSVAELLMPVGWAALAGEVEQVPQRLDGADVAGFLPVIDGCVEEFRAPEVADRLRGQMSTGAVVRWIPASRFWMAAAANARDAALALPSPPV
jgi:hypothetical protein